jgi:hypothetical protein
MRTWLKHNGLGLTMGALFLVSIVGQSLAGVREYNEDQRSHDQPTVSWAAYVRTANFAEAVFENWESEFLQMGLFILLTVYLFQKGSAESKDPDKPEEVDEDPRAHRRDPDAPLPVKRGGLLLTLYENSLGTAMLLLFVISFALHAVSGAREFSQEQREHGQAGVTSIEYVGTARMWEESLQNWQSEFMSIGAIVLLSVFLRQRGSPESKPVFMPHAETGGD